MWVDFDAREQHDGLFHEWKHYYGRVFYPEMAIFC